MTYHRQQNGNGQHNAPPLTLAAEAMKDGRFEKAIEHAKENLRNNHSPYYQCVSHNYISNANIFLGRLDQALEHAKKAIKFIKKNDIAQNTIDNSYDNLIIILCETGDFKSALEHIEKAPVNYKRAALLYRSVITCARHSNAPDIAEKAAKKIEAILETTNDLGLLEQVRETLFQFYVQFEEFEKAKCIAAQYPYASASLKEVKGTKEEEKWVKHQTEQLRLLFHRALAHGERDFTLEQEAFQAWEKLKGLPTHRKAQLIERCDEILAKHRLALDYGSYRAMYTAQPELISDSVTFKIFSEYTKKDYLCTDQKLAILAIASRNRQTIFNLCTQFALHTDSQNIMPNEKEIRQILTKIERINPYEYSFLEKITYIPNTYQHLSLNLINDAKEQLAQKQEECAKYIGKDYPEFGHLMRDVKEAREAYAAREYSADPLSPVEKQWSKAEGIRKENFNPENPEKPWEESDKFWRYAVEYQNALDKARELGA